MADKNFFELLKRKLAALRPQEENRSEDWAALHARLETSMPQQTRNRRRIAVIPLLWLVMLLSTNATWWHSNRENQAAIGRLEAKLAAMTANIAGPSDTHAIEFHDTIWKTVYLPLPTLPIYQRQSAPASITKGAAKNEGSSPISPAGNASKTNILEIKADTEAGAVGSIVQPHAVSASVNLPLSAKSLFPFPDFAPLDLRHISLLSIPVRQQLLPQGIVAAVPEAELPAQAITAKISTALRPKYFLFGASAGWLNATSKQLMHEGGIVYNIRGEMGFTRHLGVTAEFGIGKLHYKAHSPGAILGAPELPILASMDHHYLEIDVTGQRIRQISVGLRYTFAQPGKLRPFVGLNWGGQLLMPFTIQYEIQHESTGNIERAEFDVTRKIQLKNLFGLNAGFEIPLSKRFNFIMQGYYQRQWKKPNNIAPDFTGIRTGINMVL